MTKRKPPAHERITAGVELEDALDEWDLTLRQLNRSPETRKTYATSVVQLLEHQRQRGVATTVDEISPADIRSYLVAVLERTSASTAVTRWGGLLAFFKWATVERLCAEDPMAGVERPQRPELLTPVLSDDELRQIFATCGADFDGVRDLALMRFLLTTGCRRSEVAGLTLDDLDLRAQTVRVMGKGRRERLVHIEDGTALALRRYLRARKLHPKGSTTDRLWIGKLGPLTGGGIQQLLQRRAERAGVERANPHAWRHAFAHRWLAAGGTEGGLMSEAGWRSSQMVRRYARSAAAERGRAEHARLNIAGDL
ncbi:tyrosine-type recombinase/integrase [Desertimonas flava]|uniref:tyrosine-type recombinase/integrase n=1 Tax=Desertimonas flava TaxID=2064846 RepID=UPI000E34B845|nr:tyrosine-type recombinase/integrase [Desertimonas flava]